MWGMATGNSAMNMFCLPLLMNAFNTEWLCYMLQTWLTMPYRTRIPVPARHCKETSTRNLYKMPATENSSIPGGSSKQKWKIENGGILIPVSSKKNFTQRYMHTHRHTCTHWDRAHTQTHICTHTGTCTHSHTYAHTRAQAHTHWHVHAHGNTCIHIGTGTHRHTYAHTGTCIHRHT